ncbi:flagellin N-terminal helical domain-containing protein [Kineococcus sp. SYSU DK004]|uniref:flagellin N-terminal helical domain-containing protein n=1 Tax=Kineococcus sp. SYSU DK004 TaxID=3383125 RepID=UPI003D7C7FEB
MGLRVNNNIAALNSYNNLQRTDKQLNGSLEKLSSGFRINKAADDAAGLVVSEGLRSQIGGLTVAARNAQDGVNVAQTADGALGTVTSILQRMRDLAVQASNTGAQDSQAAGAAQKEIEALSLEIDRISKTTSFGSQKLLDGTYGGSAAVVASSITGIPSGGLVLAAAAVDFTIDGVFKAGTIGTPVNINVADATYATAAEYQTALQTAVDAGLDGSADAALATYQAGDVKAVVTDAGNGVWNVSLVSSKFTSLTTGEGTTAGDAAKAGVRLDTVTGTSGSGGVFQVGYGNTAADRITVSIDRIDASVAGLGTASLNVTTGTGANSAITAIDTALAKVSDTRAKLGALQNRFEHAINNLNVSIENITASESAIRDTDMAAEMTKFTKSQILSQAGTSMLAQANSASQNVLTLLRG